MEKLIQDKKLIIWGNGRFSMDFRYAFDYLKIAYCVDADSVWKLQDEEKAACVVIVCEYEPQQAMDKLDSMGWNYKKNYVLADDLFYLMDYPIEKVVQGKKVFVWGTSGAAHGFFHEIVEKNREITVVGCIDGNEQQQGKTFFGRPVYSFEAVKDKMDIFIIVASTYYFKIKEELIRAGLKENIDFTHYHNFNRKASIMLRETIYDIPTLDHVCMKPFSYGAITSQGTMSLCAALREYTESLLFDDFQSVWNSNIAKIIRLSMINRTCTFCRDKRCIYLLNNKEPYRDSKEIHFEISGSLSENDCQTHAYAKDEVINEDDYLLKAETIPKELMISIDRSCNLHCGSCRKQHFLARGGEFEKVQWLADVVKNEIIQGVEYIRLAGDGEVFYSPVYRELLNCDAVKKKKKIGILSNGTLFSPEAWELVKGEHESVKCLFSIDAPTKKTYEALRRGANYERMIQNMKFASELRKAGEIQEFSIHCVVQRANYLEMDQYVEWGLSLGVDQIEFVHIVNYGTYSEEEFENITMLEKNNECKEELKKILEKPIFQNEKINLFGWRIW